ncbi:twin-arginine translocase subunit TatB [Pseudomonas tructae]|uniref:Twin-arginine translocase subunit TatB n=1 Tax=Pseudomonas tructae TaxID=2518644 RepID=A0A411MEZ6_9PSED|nr:Sec-independent protein translocase protein TatB [Pseudomonas tructae]QBF25432.1 twin-arginine translocase subunit TatB [Pseudomonas tructae]
MFEVGFTELLLVGIVALLVLGPERLPVAARTLGRGVAQAKRALATLKAQVDRELDTQALSQELDALPLQRLEQDLRCGVSLQPDNSPTSGTP